MNKKLIAFLIGFLCLSSVFALDYTLNLTDQYTDGWDTASIDVQVNGTVVIDDATIATGNTFTQTFTVEPGDLIFCDYTAGNYPRENKYQIKNENDEVVLESGNPNIPQDLSYTILLDNQAHPATLSLPENGATNVALNGTLEWTNGEDTETTKLYLATNADFTDATIVENVTSPYSFTNLEHTSMYYWKIESANATCDTNTFSATFNFATVAGTVTLPLTEGFENVECPALPAGWNKIGTITSEMASSYNPAYAGDKMIKMKNNSYLILPPCENADARIKFFAKKTSSTADYTLEVGFLTDITDATTFTSISEVDFSTDWTECSVALENSRTIRNIAIKTTVSVAYSKTCLDNIVVEEIPANEPTAPILNSPANFAANQTLDVDLAWTAGAHNVSYDVYFSSDATLVEANDASVLVSDNQTETTYSVTALEQFTTYYWKVTTVNSEDYLVSSPIHNFTTILPNGLTLIGTGSSTNKSLPMDSYYDFGYSQSIYLANEIGQAGTITSIKYHHTLNGGPVWSAPEDVVLYMASTTTDQFVSGTSWIPVAELTEVFNGQINATQNDEWITITLDTPFVYSDNTENLVIAFDANTDSNYGSDDEFYCTETENNRSIYKRSDSDNTDPATPPLAAISSYIPNIVLEISSDVVELPAVTDLAATVANNEDVTLTWSAMENAQSYKVFRNGSMIAEDITDATYLDEDVTYGSYVYTVKTGYAEGFSAFSNEATANIVTPDGQVIVGSGTIENEYLPIAPFYKTCYSQTIYTQSELNHDGAIYSLKWHYNGASLFNTPVVISLGTTDLNEFAENTSWVAASTLTEVFNGTMSLPSTDGWVEITLDTPFNYNNTQNLVVAIDRNDDAYGSSSSKFFCTNGTQNMSIEHHHDTNNCDPADPLSGNLRVTRANMIFTFGETHVPVPVVTDLAATADANNVTLTWTSPDASITAYKIIRNDEEIVASQTELTYADNGLNDGTYNYVVKALRGDAISNPSNSVEVVIDEVEDSNPPANVQANIVSDDAVITWNEPGQGGQSLNESFENDDLGGFTIQSTNATTTWVKEGTHSLGDDGEVAPTDGEFQMWCHWANGAQDEWLISPELTCPSGNLVFDFYGKLGSTHNDHYKVNVTTDDGANWIELWDATAQPAGDNHYDTPISIDISTYAGQTVKFAWQVVDGDQQGVWSATFIDNVRIGERFISFNNFTVESKIPANNSKTTKHLNSLNKDGSFTPMSLEAFWGCQQGNTYFPNATATRNVTGYRVYRLTQGQEATEADWTLLTDTDLATDVYTLTDSDWSTLASGVYKYAVKAVYGTETSVPALSGILEKDMTGTVNVTVNDTDGNPIEGATLILDHQIANSATDGTHVFNDIHAGTYNITATKQNYTSVTQEVVVTANETTDATIVMSISNILFQDGFETYDDFAIANWGDWTLIDGDGAQTYGIQNVTFANAGQPMAYLIWNPATTTPAVTTNFPAISGAKSAATFCANGTPNDDWLISKEFTASANCNVAFKAKSASAQYIDEFQVAVSTTGTDVADFTVISEGNVTAPVEANEFSYDLSAYDGQNIRVAIHCVSNDKFLFYVDDFVVNGGSVDNNENSVNPVVTALGDNYPNPFNPETTISFNMKNAGQVSLNVYNIKGQKVKALVNEVKEAGTHTVVWNGKDNSGAQVASGVYFYRMTNGNYTSTKKMVLMK